MTTYIIKSSISLIVMFGLYWFFLRQEKLFIFNRVFLIFSILFSLSVPFVSIPVNIQNNEPQGSILTTLNSAIPSYSSEQNPASNLTSQSFNETEPLPAPVTERISLLSDFDLTIYYRRTYIIGSFYPEYFLHLSSNANI